MRTILIILLLVTNFSFSQNKKSKYKKKVKTTNIVKKRKPKTDNETDVKLVRIEKPTDKEYLREEIDKGVEQSREESVEQTHYSQTFEAVEVMPEPKGGITVFKNKISKEIVKPKVENITNTLVIARFVVMEDGSLSDIKILKENPTNLGLGKETVRVLRNSEKWTPGTMNGRNVKVYYTLPIKIVLEPKAEDLKDTEIKETEKTTEIIQTEENLVEENYDEIFSKVEIMPTPLEGIDAFTKNMLTKFKTPEVEADINATISLRFVVMKDGSLSKIVVLKETPSNLGLGKEAIRLLKKGGIWQPGIVNGNKVKTYYYLPLNLTILSNPKK